MSDLSSSASTIVRPNSAGARDFILLCKDVDSAEAVHALYYLPGNYKLMILTDAASNNDVSAWMENSSLKDRVHFEDIAAHGNESPYDLANAVIANASDSEVVKSSSTPYVVFSATAAHGIASDGARGFKVPTDSPEALASAVLSIARQAA